MACICIGVGVLCIFEIAWGLFHDRLSINLGVLGVVAGIGLLRRSPACRLIAIAGSWIGFVSLGVLIIACVIMRGLAELRYLGSHRTVPRLYVLPPLAVLFAVSLWMYRVLNRPDVARLFGETDSEEKR